ncbi:single-stranded DNA-binding protein [Morganella morganii]|uniref:single-stranded DNA-binding protein n=1 Tax=Morganella morganii TaxID=582 RepID=UPI00091CD6B1|nr:single-stranded DNA-binding protein [Morganella morganii]SGD76958.1 single stranded DNA-binding protein [Mycobacterium tuberculosis]EKL3976848.1 single-stranded DNA-binding protein [Morganella morganii]ELB1013117.1 single-stranded DNA-binding protein [Morganella morganii]MBA5838330.1 single-stranded DNA-binding protein [Morganella morganii]MBT0414213.1 single-stranded DNA-binding protein [Morganella morganii subsp. morganii]
MAINVITVSGNLGKDCEQRWTPAGKAVASFSLPVKQGYGEHEKTSWVICKMFGAKAEKLPEHLKKGMKVTVTGEFIMEEWTGQDGNKRSAPVIIVNQLDFNNNQAGSQKPQQRTQQPPAQNDPPMDFDDDIPF